MGPNPSPECVRGLSDIGAAAQIAINALECSRGGWGKMTFKWPGYSLPVLASHAIIGKQKEAASRNKHGRKLLCLERVGEREWGKHETASGRGKVVVLKEYIQASLQSEVIINTNRLTKAYGKLVAVNDLHLQVMRGDVFGFLGPNGAGKSTTIRMLLGLIRPTAGCAVIFGMDVIQHMPSILPRIGAIVETPVFYPYLSGMDNLHVVGAASGMVSGKANQRRIDEVLELVELHAQAKMAYRKYSLGMKQRLGIAAALLTDPELVLLDEPTNGLDPAGMFEIRQLIQRLAALGKTIFLSSHLLNEVQQVCNRVAILQKGNLIKQGNVSELQRGSEQVLVRLNQ